MVEYWFDSGSSSNAIWQSFKTHTMEKFKVKVIRVEYALKEIEVDANSQDEAESIALEKAYDEYYEPTNVYEVEYMLSSI